MRRVETGRGGEKVGIGWERSKWAGNFRNLDGGLVLKIHL